MEKEVFILSALRSPIGSFLGSLSSVSATDLGSIALKGVINSIKLDAKEVDEVFMGNVLQAAEGQAPAKQAALKAGIPDTTPCTTINKVCASGMKSVIIGAQSILCSDNQLVACGGMESMSQVPFYNTSIRKGNKYGNIELLDGILKDGLQDVYSGVPMGNFAEICAKKYNISREEQDNFAISSYKKAKNAWEKGFYKNEIIDVEYSSLKGEKIIITEDEEFKNVNFEKIPNLKAVFVKEGTVTAANASTLNDGSSAMILSSGSKAKELNIKPIAKIIAYADASQAPEFFTTTPAIAINIALKKANLSIEEIDYFEINEAFSVVALANINILNLNPEKVNIFGGAVAIGHPLGNSGSRIIVTLINILKQNNAKYGCAAICNGGGGASAIIIENCI